ncbi:MAG: S66 peptidase family protein [Anaerovoracaceae bacterium]
MINKPKKLELGARIALIAPSAFVEEEKLKLSLASMDFLGLEPVLYPSCTMRHGYFAGIDYQRAKDINDAFTNPHVDGVFCLRGGYGATRVLPLLDYEVIKNNPKLFLGYSDITAFHLAFNKICKLATLHSPMPTRGWDTLDELSLQSLESNLFSSVPVGKVSIPPELSLKPLISGTAEGPMTGGNLSLLVSTLGSPYEVDTRGKIIFIEDVDDEPYKIDRGLTALSLAGKFADCAGIVIGTFAGCEPKDPSISLSLSQIFDEIITPYNKPTINWFPAGHIYPHISIPMGIRARLTVSEESELEFLESFAL